MDINLVSCSDFRKNQKKYLELAKRERVIITQKRTKDIFELVKVKKLESSNLQRVITADELFVDIEADDSTLYAYLSETRPEGKVILNPQEKQEFEDWLGISDKA
ncbi:MAG: hypothetical protein LBR26_04090 [Prevotella sp.]|jgi:hypothetical protein|nr:hypothetical protein [Prevotella sp.]